MSEHTIRPVMIGDQCVGHLVYTCRGWKAFNADDRPVGVFPTAQDGVEALRAVVSHEGA